MDNQITGSAAAQAAKDFKEASDAMIAMEQYKQLSDKLKADGYSKEQIYAYICGMSDIGAVYKDAAISDLKDALGKQSAMLEALMKLYNTINSMADVLMDGPGYNRKVQESLNSVYKDLHTVFSLATSPAATRVFEQDEIQDKKKTIAERTDRPAKEME